jgi:hypothetical protein
LNTTATGAGTLPAEEVVGHLERLDRTVAA